MRLTFNNQTKIEHNPSIIETLKRKGWIEVAENSPPVYDPNTQELRYDSFTRVYSVLDLSKSEIELINFNKLISNGFLVQPEGFVLGLTENDRAAFSQMLSLVKEALDLGLITSETPQIISDKNGQKHQLATLRFRQVMVAYGFYFKGLWDGLDS